MTKAPARFSRRVILQGGLAGLAAMMSPSLVTSCASPSGARPAKAGGSGKLVSRIADIGPLGEPDANGLRLPAGFTSRIVGRTNERPVPSADYLWHRLPDGGATFPLDEGGYIYVSNSEVPDAGGGGVGALRFDASGKLVDTYSILKGTTSNCSGGPTPWGTWLSCEEIARGRVFECDPRGKREAIVRPSLGIFKHEAATIDRVRHHVYMTEDEPNGCFYRFVPDKLDRHGFADVSSGALEVAEVGTDGRVAWRRLPDPQFEGAKPTREQVASATHFNGGEGIWWHGGVVYFSTKGDDRVWAYDTVTEKLTVLYDAHTAQNPVLTGVDNLTVSRSGDVLVAEDSGDMQIVAIQPNGELKALLQVVGHDDKSEITGPAFDPLGTRLYFSSQRGTGSGGVTFEITGPFHSPA
jgi:uncharacterized protein